MRVAIIIPARLHSTRLPGKLLLPAAGLPLICHTLLAAENLRCLAPEIFTPPIVATDAPEIAQVVRDFSRERRLACQAVLTRSNHLSGSDRIAEAAEALPPEIDHVLNLQGDEPEIDPASLLPLLECLAKGKADLATLAYPLPASEATDPNLVKVVVDRALRALYFSRANLPYRRSTNLNPPAYGHVGVYLYRRPALERFVALPPGELELAEQLEQLRALENGMLIAVALLASRPAKGIDTPEDFAAFSARLSSGKVG